MTKAKHPPTPEQQAVINHLCTQTSSLLVEAYAGAAKSTTLEMALAALDPKPGQVLAVAFNKKIAEELKVRVPYTVSCATLNSLGHRAWGDFLRKRLQVDGSKMYHLVKEVLEGKGLLDDEFIEVSNNVQKLVIAAKNVGLVPEHCFNHARARSFVPDDAYTWEELAFEYDLDFNQNYLWYAREALKLSIKRAFEGYIDFADQLYMSTCWEAPFTKFPIVVVDEAQDLSSLNHHMLAKCLAYKGRLIAVGDRRQAIYGFRGAMHNSMDALQERFKMDTLTLSTTFRCGKAIADHVRDRVPYIKSPSWAAEGSVEYLSDWTVESILPNSAVICRNNKPLIALAYQFIRAGRPVVINGGDFGEVLIKLLKKLCGATGSSGTRNEQKMRETDIPTLLEKAKQEEIKELTKAMRQGKENRIAGIRDKFASIQVVIKMCRGATAYDIMEEISQIFSNKHGSVVLSTGHKSKGLEWEVVYHLDSHLVPSRYAERKGGAPLEQELNLKYVISTRAKNRLIYISNEREDTEDERSEDGVDLLDTVCADDDSDYGMEVDEEVANG